MFRYVFRPEGGAPLAFEVDETRLLEDAEPTGQLPEWLLLEHHRCDVCSLEPGSRRTCPAALAIRGVVEAFGDYISFETLRVDVHVDPFQFTGEVPAQQAVRSLLGLMFSLSACPVLGKLRPMARFHLPFGSREHTEFRFLGMYLVAQRLRQLEGLTPDWELSGLLDLFQQLHAVNRFLACRLREAAREDAALNSLVILDNLAYSAEVAIERRLTRLRELFKMYFD